MAADARAQFPRLDVHRRRIEGRVQCSQGLTRRLGSRQRERIVAHLAVLADQDGPRPGSEHVVQAGGGQPRADDVNVDWAVRHQDVVERVPQHAALLAPPVHQAAQLDSDHSSVAASRTPTSRSTTAAGVGVGLCSGSTACPTMPAVPSAIATHLDVGPSAAARSYSAWMALPRSGTVATMPMDVSVYAVAQRSGAPAQNCMRTPTFSRV